MPDEPAPKPKRVGETITREQRKMLTEMFEENGQGGEKKYTNSDIAAAVGVSEPTVIKYHKRWEGARKQTQEIRNVAFQVDPIDSLETYLARVPGFSDEKLAFIVDSLRANPARAASPQAVFQYLMEIGRLSNFVAGEAVAAMFPGQAPLQMPQGPWQVPPGPYGMPPQQPQAWPQSPWTQPQPPYGYPPPMPPYGWPYPPQPQPQGLTLADVKAAIEEAMGRAEAPQTEYEEIEEPIIHPTTKEPMTRPDGTPYVRITRRPIGTGGSAQALTPLETLRQAAAALREISPPTPAPSGNSEERTMLVEIQKQLAAEQARREQAEKDGAKLQQSEQALRAAELKAAVAGAGLPPDAQILKSGIEMGDKHLDKLLTNNDKRMDRIEGMITKLITPQPGGVPMPVDEGEIARLEARTRELDAAAAAPAQAPVTPVMNFGMGIEGGGAPAPQPPLPTPPAAAKPPTPSTTATLGPSSAQPETT